MMSERSSVIFSVNRRRATRFNPTMILLNAVKNLIVFGADRVKIDVYIQS